MSDDDYKFTAEELANFNEKTKEILFNLTAREAKILRSRFGIILSEDFNPDDVGHQFEVTRKRIREIEEKALKKLKEVKPQLPRQNCSFCGKSVNDVKKIFASENNKAFICNECIRTFGKLLGD